LEALLTLDERLTPGERELCLIAPNSSLTYRPLSAVAEFATYPPHDLPLGELASSIAARLVPDRVALVDEEQGQLLTHDGDWIGFDYLLLAVGAREHRMPGGWLRWPAGGDPGILRTLLGELRSGQLKRIAVFVPAHAAWPLAGYELALILAEAARAEELGAKVWLMTEEQRPLEPLGVVAENIVSSELSRAEVAVRSGAPVQQGGQDDRRGGTDWFTGVISRLLAPAAGSSGNGSELSNVRVDHEQVGFDRVISLPVSIGPDIGGVTTDGRGFIAVDEHCRVAESERIWACGDCTTLPLKHSTLAVAQADAAADALAASMGAPLDLAAFEPTLTGVLVSGAAERWWGETTSLPAGLDPATHCLWWPPGKVLGGRLARYVARRDPSARPLLLSHPRGTALQVHLISPSPSSATGRRVGRPSHPASRSDADKHALLLGIYARQVYALHRVEREADERLGHLEQGLEQQRTRSREVLRRLNAAGYLVKQH
jgi:sulfide:quinone oxidoreductase